MQIRETWKRESKDIKSGDRSLSQKFSLRGSKFIAPKKSEDSLRKKNAYYPGLSNYISSNYLLKDRQKLPKYTSILADQVI